MLEDSLKPPRYADCPVEPIFRYREVKVYRAYRASFRPGLRLLAGPRWSARAKVDRRWRAVPYGPIASRQSGLAHPDDPVQSSPVNHPCHAARLVLQERLDRFPFEIRQSKRTITGPLLGRE